MSQTSPVSPPPTDKLAELQLRNTVLEKDLTAVKKWGIRGLIIAGIAITALSAYVLWPRGNSQCDGMEHHIQILEGRLAVAEGRSANNTEAIAITANLTKAAFYKIVEKAPQIACKAWDAWSWVTGSCK